LRKILSLTVFKSIHVQSLFVEIEYKKHLNIVIGEVKNMRFEKMENCLEIRVFIMLLILD
jgi:hypothetical protein